MPASSKHVINWYAFWKLERENGLFETDKERRIKYYKINLSFEIGKGWGVYRVPTHPQLFSLKILREAQIGWFVSTWLLTP